MAKINAVGNGLSGTTGTGNFVGATSPTLVTPVLGVASATSINFGQTTLNLYQEGTWTPVDGSGAGLSFSAAAGTYTRIGRIVIASCQITYPATADTSNANVAGLPFTCANDSAASGGLVMFTNASTLSKCLTAPNTTNFNLFVASGAQITNAAMASTVNYFQLTYFV